MLEVVLLAAGDARVVPWKNGRGETRELALWPEGASFERGDFDWRVSLAGVSEPGAFSSFPGFERILVVTEGAGLLLSHGDHAPRTRARALEPVRFSGDWETAAELLAGPVRDFNLIYRPGSVRAELEVLRLGARRARESLGAGQAFVHLPAGPVTARVTGEDEPIELGAQGSLWIRGLSGGEELELAGRSSATTALLVRLGPDRGRADVSVRATRRS